MIKSIPQSHPPSGRLAYNDFDFIMRDVMDEEGIIAQCDREPIPYTETAEQAWHLNLASYAINGNKHFGKKKATL
jgi:hypothetical protein